MRTALLRSCAWAPIALALVACKGSKTDEVPAPTPVPSGPVGPSVPSLYAAQRLTGAQYRASIRDIFGADVVVPPALEPDVALDGLEAIGASKSTVSARGVEQYEAAAMSIGSQVIKSPALLAKVLTCKPATATDEACAKIFVATTGRRVWRRPLTEGEITSIAAIIVKAATTLGTFENGVQYGIAALLQSSHFLYRPAVGEPDPEHPGKKRYTGFELAARMSYFLWNTTPDDELLDAAQNGKLGTHAGVMAEANRMLASPKAREGMRNFVREWLRLGDLDRLEKDAKLFTTYSPDLGPMAREETLRLFEDFVFERNADLRDILTTRRTFVTPKLASMYQVAAPDPSGFAAIELPESSPRIGLLGHISILALYAHPTSSSATKRGKFIRERLLCTTIPSPPVDVDTALPEPSATAKTLRDRVKVHLQESRCAACHKITDPIGLSLESFDGIGRFRTKENGATIDTSGELDGTSFTDSRGLAQAIHDHRDFGPCIAQRVYEYATGFKPTEAERATLEAFAERFKIQGYKLRPLLADMAASPAFRIIGEAH